MRAPRLLLLGVLAALLACGTDDATARREIRALMHARFDQPQAPLQIAPLIVAGDHAVADWSQQDRGGRALLRREHGQWQIVLCAGDALRDAGLLQQAGVPAGDAQRLSAGLRQAEESMSAERLQRFASFQGTVRMGARGEHPQH